MGRWAGEEGQGGARGFLTKSAAWLPARDPRKGNLWGPRLPAGELYPCGVHGTPYSDSPNIFRGPPHMSQAPILPTTLRSLVLASTYRWRI